MFRLTKASRRRDESRSHVHLRYADEWVGFLVLATFGLFVFAIVQAGILRDWLTPSGKLHFNLPESGIAGLAVGNDIELMGIRIGAIRSVKINPHGRMYAVAEIDPQFEPYIREDSRVIIRRRFVVAGASYIEIERGAGRQLDWEFAELQAHVEPNPADSITETIADIRAGLMPALKNATDVMADVAAMTQTIRTGKGSIGGLIKNDGLLQHADAAVLSLRTALDRMKPLEVQLRQIAQKADETMRNVRHISGELRQASPAMKNTLVQVNEASAQLPALLTQAQVTAESLGKLTDQLRRLWILGGRGGERTPARLSAGTIKP